MKTFYEKFRDKIDCTDNSVVLFEGEYKEIQADAYERGIREAKTHAHNGWHEAENQKRLKLKAQDELRLFVAGLKGALYGLSTHPVTVDFQGFCISEKSKEKLTCIHEMIARYEQP